MAYSIERGQFRKEHTLVCQSDKCGKPFTSIWKFKKYCSQVCQTRGSYVALKASQIARGLNTRRIPKQPGLRLGLTPEQAFEHYKQVRRDTNKRNREKRYATYKANPRNGWAFRLWAKYKITPEDYFRFAEQQGHKCAMCEKTAAHDDIKVLHVDHCHDSGKVRGLLCYNCNCLLGQARDRIDILKNAIAYLEKANGTY